MDKAIIINNASERPFGPLSNKAFVYITLDNKLYSSVTNYIYSSLLTVSANKKSLQHADISYKIPNGINKVEYDQKVSEIMGSMDEIVEDSDSINYKILQNFSIFQLYKYYNTREIFSVKLKALNKAYKEKFKNNELQKLLFKTGNAQLKYISPNDLFFGINQEGEGYNAIGKILTQLRSRLRNEKRINDEKIRREKFINNLYNIYVADFILKNEIKEGDFLDKYSHIDEKTNLLVYDNPEEIIKKYKSEISVNKKGVQIYVENKQLPYGIVDKKYILELFLNEKLNLNVMREFYNKGTLVQTNKRDGYDTVIKIQKKKTNDIIFNMYLKYMLRKNYTDIDSNDYQSVIDFKTPLKSPDDTVSFDISTTKYEDLKSRVIDLFKLGMLSASLSTDIDKELKKINIPTFKEISNVKHIVIPKQVEKTEVNIEKIQKYQDDK